MASADPTRGVRRIEVAHADDPELAGLLAPYRAQKDSWLRAQREGGTGLGDGLFMAEGDLVVRTLLESGEYTTRSVLCTPARLEAMLAALARLPDGTPVLVAERPVLEAIVGFDLHRGVLALGERSRTPTSAEVMERAAAGRGVLVLCEDLANHDNTGAIFRNTACLAGGHSGVLLSPGCCDPLYRKSLRVSMGHALRIPFATLAPWPESLEGLEAHGFEALALTPSPSAEDIRRVRRDPNKPLAVLVGAEGPGLTRAALARAEAAGARRVRIPMAPETDSLNVATALAIALSWLADRPG